MNSAYCLLVFLNKYSYFSLSELSRWLSWSVSDSIGKSVAIDIDWASCCVSRSSRGVSTGFDSISFSSFLSSCSYEIKINFLLQKKFFFIQILLILVELIWFFPLKNYYYLIMEQVQFVLVELVVNVMFEFPDHMTKNMVELKRNFILSMKNFTSICFFNSSSCRRKISLFLRCFNFSSSAFLAFNCSR